MAERELRGRVAMVTGASRGLGRAIAVALGEGGAAVALVGRDRARLEETASQVRARDGRAGVFVADVTREEDVNRLREEVLEEYGRIDIVVNNAGVNLRKPVEEFTLAEWMWVVNSNLTSVFLMTRAVVPVMKKAGWGRIINLGSTMSHVALPHRTAYASSKTALLGFTRAAALELAPHGITVVAISPGPFATEMNTALTADPEESARFISKVPLGRWGRVEEVGRLARYLCSEEAGFITGSDVLIDGGWCAQ